MAGEYAKERYEFANTCSAGELGSLIRSVSQALGWKVRDSQTSTWFIEKGSNVRLWLLGTWLPGGTGNIPIGMTIKLVPSADGQSIQIEAYDRLGWWLDRYLKAETPFERRVREVLSQEAARYVDRLQNALAG